MIPRTALASSSSSQGSTAASRVDELSTRVMCPRPGHSMTAKSGIVSGSNPLCKSLMSENDLLMGVDLRQAQDPRKTSQRSTAEKILFDPTYRCNSSASSPCFNPFCVHHRPAHTVGVVHHALGARCHPPTNSWFLLLVDTSRPTGGRVCDELCDGCESQPPRKWR